MNLGELSTYRITSAAVPATPTATSPLPVTAVATTRATIRFSRQGDRIALATESPPGHWWATFDQATGRAGTWNEIDLLSGYSIDFSPNGLQIYFAASAGVPGYNAAELRQHDTSTGNTIVLNPAGIALTFSGVALAPDGNLYSAPTGALTLHRVLDPDVGGAANFQVDALDLGGCTLGFNLSKQLSLPSVGCTSDDRCDDGDDCTVDSCDTATGECSYTCLDCDP